MPLGVVVVAQRAAGKGGRAEAVHTVGGRALVVLPHEADARLAGLAVGERRQLRRVAD